MTIQGKKVLVTGADGFIWSHLTEMLVALGAQVHTLCYVYNGGKGSSLNVAEVIAVAKAEAGRSKPVRCGQSVRSHEIHDTRVYVEKARSELGWSAKRGFRDGVRTIVARIREKQ